MREVTCLRRPWTSCSVLSSSLGSPLISRLVAPLSLQIMNMEGWVLLGADRQEVPVTMYPGQDLVEADLSDVPDVYQDLHWHAPKTYLGDKVRGGGATRASVLWTLGSSVWFWTPHQETHAAWLRSSHAGHHFCSSVCRAPCRCRRTEVT